MEAGAATNLVLVLWAARLRRAFQSGNQLAAGRRGFASNQCFGGVAGIGMTDGKNGASQSMKGFSKGGSLRVCVQCRISRKRIKSSTKPTSAGLMLRKNL